MKNKTFVIFQPSGIRGEVETNITVLEAANQLGVEIESICAGQKKCGKCKIIITEGNYEKYNIRSSQENTNSFQDVEGQFITQLEKGYGYRLACCTYIHGPLLIEIPEESQVGKQVINKSAKNIPIISNPLINLISIKYNKAKDNRLNSQVENIKYIFKEQYNLENLNFDYEFLKRISNYSFKDNEVYTFYLWNKNEIIDFVSSYQDDIYGLAIDIGSSTVAIYICELNSCQVKAYSSFINPQIRYGEDIMTRASYAKIDHNCLPKMRDILLDKINYELESLLLNQQIWTKDKKNAISPNNIQDVVIVGNTVMHHIFFGFNPKFLAESPFLPTTKDGLNIKARDIGIKVNPSAYVYSLPIEASFVGADNVAVLISEVPYKNNKSEIIIDIGTNGEIIISYDNYIVATSCATGPALEGAQLRFGMRAIPGAIEKVKIDPQSHEVDYKIIGYTEWKSALNESKLECRGICGSGAIDILAELFNSNIIHSSGAFNNNLNLQRLRFNHETNFHEFVVAWAKETKSDKDIVVDQKDIRQLQLAKAAVYTACKLLMNRLDITFSDIDVIKIAGSFGQYINPESMLTIGFLPYVDKDKIKFIGNAAGDGARIALCNQDKRKEAELIAPKVDYIELTLEETFQTELMKAIKIPHAEDLFAKNIE